MAQITIPASSMKSFRVAENGNLIINFEESACFLITDAEGPTDSQPVSEQQIAENPPAPGALDDAARELGARLRLFRERKKISQADVAHVLRRSQSFISAIETGQIRIKNDELAAELEELLQIP